MGLTSSVPVVGPSAVLVEVVPSPTDPSEEVGDPSCFKNNTLAKSKISQASVKSSSPSFSASPSSSASAPSSSSSESSQFSSPVNEKNPPLAPTAGAGAFSFPSSPSPSALLTSFPFPLPFPPFFSFSS